VPGPGDAEVERGHGRRGDGHGGRDGIFEEGEGLRGLVAGAVGGGDGQGRAEGVGRIEGIGVRRHCGDDAAQRACPACPVPGRCTCGVGTCERSQRVAPAPAASGKARPKRPARVSVVTAVMVKI
jgi:hypothetical protein